MKKRNFWPWAIVGWLGLVAMINSVVFYLAQSSKPAPMAAGSPYAEGLAYESEVASRKAFAETGMKPILRWKDAASRIEMELEGWNRWSSAGRVEKIILKGLRADGKRRDIEIELRPVAGKAGFFEGRTTQPMDRGSWFLSLQVELRGGGKGSDLLWKGVGGPPGVNC